MSGRRGKKRPIAKKVQTRNDELARRRGVRKLRERFLIVCEDTKSSKQYFDAFVVDRRLSATSVVVAHSGGRTQPLQVVERAIELSDEAKSERMGTEPFDQVWCVIDGDYGSNINNARSKATIKGIELAISTMCFEYWLLLHYEESARPTEDCAAVVRELKREHLKEYDKGKFDFSNVVGRVDEACARAKRLREPRAKMGETPEAQNPCSEVYRLIEAMLDAT